MPVKKSTGGRAKTAVGATQKIGGKTFKKVSCHAKKTDAKKRAESIRAAGGTARIKKNGSVHCVMQGPAAKARRRRRA